ncbi:MAG: ABC transporter ATP-binding protein [Candidatus Giovannonibacteria bacterium]|nr:MAG: ABC transporter ATP-binding protein [Candidatus Giovannonibacteria bacterium]
MVVMQSAGKKIFGLFRLFGEAFGDFKWAVAAFALLSFLSSVLEGIGINAVIPLFSFLNNGAGGTDIISRMIGKFFNFFYLPFTLQYLVLFIVVVFVIKAIVFFAASFIAAKTTSEFARRKRSLLFSQTLFADWPYLTKHKLGYLDQILTTYINNSSALFSYVSSLIIVAANLLIYIVLAVNISATVAFAAFFLALASFYVFRPLFRKNAAASSEMSAIFKDVAHFINESILGIKTIKSIEAKDKIAERADNYFDRLKELDIRITLASILTSALIQPLALFFIMAALLYFYMSDQGLNMASFAVIVYAINKIFTQAQQGQSFFHSVISYEPYLRGLMHYENEIRGRKEKDLGERDFNFRDRLEFNNVHFTYGASYGPVLNGINFFIKKGEMAGLIGPSGVGKTTIVDLILRLLEPQRGAITLDGVDIYNLKLKEWRTRVGYVSQDIFLMNDTVENNIKFYGENVTDDDMIEAARMANIFDFIESLPEKFKTFVGERGIQLSVGQRQRIALARVLARHPEILLLDEATSSLDNESEILIQKSIEGLRGKITVLAIAHRLSTVKASDKLIALDAGKIIEEGSPAMLLKNEDSYFFKTYNLRA